MNGNSLVIDSNIIIYLSKGRISFNDVFNHHDKYYLSIISIIEVLGYQFKNKEEQDAIEGFLSFFQIVFLDDQLAKKVIEIRKQRKIKLPDAIIFATAQITGSDFMTRNISDFNNLDPDVKMIDPGIL